MSYETIPPREEGATITSILASTTSLGVSLPIGLNSVTFATFLTLEFLFTMLPGVVLLDASEVAEGASRVMVDTSRLGAQVDLFLNLVFVGLLSQLPRQVVSSPMKLKILLPLESFVAHFAYETVCCHQCLG